MISILYRCRCMDAEAAVPVRDRLAVEDVVAWVDNVVRPALGADHQLRSPACRSTTTEYVKIPVPENAPFIGGPPTLDA